MSPGGRRALLALALAAGVLFAGRAIMECLAERWWFLHAAPQAYPFHLRRTLLRYALDLWAVLLSALWWIAHARTLVAAAHDPSAGAGGNPMVRRALRHGDAQLWAHLIGATLGVLMGLGAGNWADPMILAWQDLRFGVDDPALDLDVGLLVGRLPIWLRLHAFLATMVIATLGVVALGHVLAGSVRLGRGRLVVIETARRQLGLLLALLAAVIAVQQTLLPYALAAGLPRPLEPEVVRLHQSVAFVLVGVSLAVVVLSSLWAFRAIHRLAAGGWLTLSSALLIATYALPEGTDWPTTATHRTTEGRFEALGFGYDTAPAVPEPDTSLHPALWDPLVLADLAPEQTPVPARFGGPAHAVLRPDALEGFDLFVSLDDSIGPGGEPLFLASLSPPVTTADLTPLASLPPLSIRPDAPRIGSGAGPAGVLVGGMLRRLALGWALQSVRILGREPTDRLLWHGDPLSRFRRVAPFVHWEQPTLTAVGGQPTWRAQGLVWSESFPASRRFQLDGVRVGHARPALVGTITAATGAVRVFLHPDADPLALAWERATAGLVEPAEALPEDAARSLEYLPTLFSIHTSLWMGAEATPSGRDTTVNRSLAAGTPHGPVAVIADSTTGLVVAVLEGRVEGVGRMRLLVWRPAEARVEWPPVLQRRWERLGVVATLRDSAASAGVELVPGVTHVVPTAAGLLSYRLLWSLPAAGEPRLALVTAARGNAVAAGRTFREALRNLQSAQAEAIGPAPGESAMLYEARRLLRMADSAFRRGDLASFGIAFAALRLHLERGDTGAPAPAPQPPPPPLEP